MGAQPVKIAVFQSVQYKGRKMPVLFFFASVFVILEAIERFGPWKVMGGMIVVSLIWYVVLSFNTAAIRLSTEIWKKRSEE